MSGDDGGDSSSDAVSEDEQGDSSGDNEGSESDDRLRFAAFPQAQCALNSGPGLVVASDPVKFTSDDSEADAERAKRELAEVPFGVLQV